ncbi:MAG: translocation/assembly module TamB domain-containing protein [Saprospiraceae bacterium]|nr:translocation/assembly module TamB domain-containing protein [Pyrinomonadaceae bacterium]
MAEDEIEQVDQGEPTPEARRRAYFTRRNTAVGAGLIAILLVLIVVVAVIFYRTGVSDNYVKSQFVTKMADIGIVFDADVFRLRVAPLELELKNATFNDKITGEKLFFIRDARLSLTVQNLYAWQLSRDISIDKTEISGAEVWVRFDAEGKSNFSNLKFVDDQAGGRVNFKYDSINFALRDSVIHFGDVSRKIEADANNVVFLLEPENLEVPDDQKRYKFDLTSTDSKFVYDEKPLTPVDIRAVGIADRMGADISQFKLTTPIGESTMNGRLSDWAALKYNLNIESTVDLTQTSNIFPLGTTLRGVGNFKGNVSGEGANYKIDGSIDSQSLQADGIYLKAVNVAATVEGTNSQYEANGTAIAELLTFEDFRIEFPKIAGNVRGTGTDFRWVGELQAAAAKSKAVSLGGLFLSDAVAEYKDKELTASAGTGRAQKFSIKDSEFANLVARNLKFSTNDGVTNLTAPNAQADSFNTEDYKLRNIRGRNLRVRDTENRTDVTVDGLQAQSADIKGTRAQNLTADELRITNNPNSVELQAKNLRAGQLNADGTNISGIEAPEISIVDTPANTVIYSDRLRVAKVETAAATLGSLNIAGVRLTIRQGRVEGTSKDIDAGTVILNKSSTLAEGGRLENVTIAKPVFVLEPSGRYRASADMSLGGGIIGNIPLGSAQASVNVNNDRVELSNLTADVMNGRLNGNATIAFNTRNRSSITADFTGLDLAKIVALQGGRIIPLEGQATGSVNLTLNGTDYRTTSGTINADIAATAGDAARGTVPVNGKVQLSATNGLFNVDLARLNTDKSQLSATGRFDLRNDDSNLNIALNSTDASEIDRLVRVLGISPAIEQQFDSMQVQLAGNLKFDGSLTGNLTDPTIDGKASLDSVSLRGRELGSVTSDIFVSPAGIEIRNGSLLERDGGNVAFTVSIPNTGANNIAVQATLTNVDAANLIAALPIENLLPAGVRDFSAQTSGTVNISGLPNQALGEINLSSTAGSVAGQSFDGLLAKATFQGTVINLENFELRSGEGLLKAKGTYDRESTAFDFDLDGKNVQLAGLRPLFGNNEAIPAITGIADITAKATGESDRTSTYNINFTGIARDVVVNENPFGQVTFNGSTANQVLNADLTAVLDGRPQLINATVNFGDENLPFRVQTEFNQSPLGPFVALVPQLKGIPIAGTGTGRIDFGGNLSQKDDAGNSIFTTANLTGTAEFSQLALQIQDTPLVATEPVVVRFNTREIVFESARFAGGGSNVTIAGAKAITEDGINNLAIDGRINLALLNVFPSIASTDTFFAGFADVSIRLAGVNRTAGISGTANIENASVATFIGSDRLTFDRLKGRLLFTSNQVQIDEVKGFLGGGPFVASGGALIGENLKIASFRIGLNGTNITVPLPEDFITTGDAELEISGRRIGSDLAVLIAGNIRARRSLYSQDIDLANIVGARREGSLSSGSSSIYAPRFDLTIEGRDALVVRNNIADLTASVSLRLTGNTNNPQISGRITANSGTILFRKDRYIVQRAVLEFPPNTEIEPIINLQAESEIGGYQIFVNLSGPLTDTELLNATVRSSPALPQADVISLITTGNLSNTESGIPTLASTGINTAAEILTDSIINNPARKATDKLFGLNVFEIDPIISGERLNPSARLTVGRQINNNLRVTYATNLSQDQNQVLALEYRVSNKLSVIAQYEQRSLSNVTQNRNNFSLEVRFRRRF